MQSRHSLSTGSRPGTRSIQAGASATTRPAAEYWRVERVARFLDVSKKRVYQLVRERRLEAVRLGPRQMRIARASLEAYLRELHSRAADELDA